MKLLFASKSRFLRGIGMVVVILVLGGSGCLARTPIKIGFSAGLTGRNAALGVDGRDGALLATTIINESGGIQGRKIDLVIRDDFGTPDGALEADQELIDAGVNVIIGHMTSAMTIAAWPLIENSGVIFISPTTSTPEISGLDDNFFRLIPINSFPAKAIAAYSFDELGLKRAAIFYDTDNLAYTETYRDGFVEKFQALGGNIVKEYPFSSSDEPDFESAVTEVGHENPDVILLIASAVDSALIAQHIKIAGLLDAQILASNWSMTADLIQNGGHSVDGILAAVTNDESNRSPEYIAFETKFEEEFGRTPTFAAIYGYESILVLAKALEKTNGQSDGLKEALLATQGFMGVNGKISFDPYGDVIRTLYLVIIQDGEFQTVQQLNPDPIP